MSFGKFSSRIVFLACLLPAASFASVNFNQTFSNNTGTAAGGFNWWFTPDCTASSLGSSVFSTVTTTHYNPGTHGYSTTLRNHYSSGNVNSGSSSTQWGTLSNNSVIGYRTEWTNTNGVPIGSANLPVSLGGVSYVNLNNDRVWMVRIDNPNDYPYYINNLLFGFSQLHYAGPALQNFSNWTLFGSGIVVQPGSAFEHEVVVPGVGYFPLASAELSIDLASTDVSTLIFQVTPEPTGLALLVLGTTLAVRRAR